MSLLQKASIITTPTAYAEDYLYSIKPAYALGSELVTNGDFSTDSDWAEDGGAAAWSISGGKANCVVNASTRFLNQTNALPAAGALKTYQVIYTISNYVQGALRISVGGYNSTPARLANGTYTEILQVTNPSSNKSIYLQANPNTIGSIDNLSVKEITDADFDFDRNSTGTRVNEDYLIEDVPYNLSTYSEDFSLWSSTGTITRTSNIAIAPDGTLTADGIQDTTGSTFKRVRANISVSGNSTITGSCFIKKVSSETGNTGFGLTFSGTSTKVAYGIIDSVNGTMISHSSTITPTFKIESANNDYWRFSMTATDTGNNTNLEFGIYGTLSSNGTSVSAGAGSLRTIWGAQLVKGDQPKDYLKTTDRLDIPRIDYTNGEPSILLEPSRTNLVSNSNNPYSLEQVTQTSVSSPEGINNAFRLTETTANAQHFAQILSSVTSGVVHTISFFIKKGNGYTTARLYTQSAKINSDVTVNFETKSITLAGTHIVAGSEKLETYPNDWFRVSYSATPIATGSMYIYAVVKDLSSYTGSTDNYIDYYGFQVEAGSYATSLIHTSGSAVTRSADSANNAGNSDLINSTEGVLYAEIKALADDSTYRQITLSDGTITNRIGIFYQNTSNQIGVESSGTGTNLGIYNQNLTITNVNKIALKYKANDCALWINGTQVATDTSFTAFSSGTLSQINFDKGDGSSDFYGNVKSVMVFKEALTDLELEKLTGYNNHELYMNYYNRLSYLGLAEEYNVESDINNYIL
jgi:hypothetical protein